MSRNKIGLIRSILNGLLWAGLQHHMKVVSSFGVLHARGIDSAQLGLAVDRLAIRPACLASH